MDETETKKYITSNESRLSKDKLNTLNAATKSDVTLWVASQPLQKYFIADRLERLSDKLVKAMHNISRDLFTRKLYFLLNDTQTVVNQRKTYFALHGEDED